MATTSTARLQLLKVTPGTGEKVLVQLDLNDNWDKIDAAFVGPGKLPAAPTRRNTADSVTSGTDSLWETWTGVLKANQNYMAEWAAQCNTTATPATPNCTLSLRLIAGGSAAITDPQIAIANFLNTAATSLRVKIDTPFTVPTDGTYTVSFTANSGGGTNTFNVLASGGAGNAGNKRYLMVRPMGEL
jgi:hypothetical protein